MSISTDANQGTFVLSNYIDPDYQVSWSVHTNAANGKPRAAQRIVEFPQRPTLDDVISERIIFEVGDTRFAIKWTAEIEQLPPAGPVAVEQKQRLKPNRSSQVRR